MGLKKIEFGSKGHHPRWVDRGMALVVMALDVQHVHGRGHPRVLVEIKHIAPEIGVIHKAANIAF